MSIKKVKQRSKKWHVNEIEALIRGIAEQKQHILGSGSLSSTVSLQSRKQAWVKVTQTVNCVNISGTARTVKQTEHKWWDLKAAAKKRVLKFYEESNKNGEASVTSMVPTDRDFRIVSILRSESTEAIHGDDASTSWLTTENISKGVVIKSEVDDETVAADTHPIFSRGMEENPLVVCVAEGQTNDTDSSTSPDETESENLPTKKPSRKRKRKTEDITDVQKDIRDQLRQLVTIHSRLLQLAEMCASKYLDAAD